jgi:hypothetical protein
MKLCLAPCECLAALLLHGGPVTSIAAKLNRLMPLFLAVIGILALVQLFVYLGQWLSKMQLGAWLVEHATLIEWVLCLAAGVSLSLVFLGWLRATKRLPQLLTRWTWLNGCSRQAYKSS